MIPKGLADLAVSGYGYHRPNMELMAIVARINNMVKEGHHSSEKRARNSVGKILGIAQLFCLKKRNAQVCD